MLVLQISAGCIILVIICTLGFHVIVTTATTAKIETTEKLIDSTEENEKQHEVLEKAESKDNKAEIIKHIQRVNNDGTYTVGYEADDGTFKIESRDVLGNVKGTFGYIDSNGEIKRVSYTANNGTGLKNNPQTSSEEIRENPKFNRTLLSSTTRRPSYPTSSSPATASTRGTVIQTIPRRLRILTSSSTSEKPYKEYSPSSSPVVTGASKAKGNDPSSTIGTVVYATSVPTSKSYVNIRPTPLPGTNIRQQLSEQQISRPEKLEIDHHVSQVQISTNREISTSKPVTEDVDEKDEEKLIIRGNTLRRQLSQDADSNLLYGPSSASIRNLPSGLSSGQKIPALVLAARQRASQIQSTINSHAEKSYSKQNEKTSSNAADEPTTQSTSEHTYLTQSPVQDQIPANKLIHQNSEQENRVLRKSEHRPPQFVRVQGSPNGRPNAPQFVRIPLPQSGHESEQYLRETTQVSSKPEIVGEPDPVGVGQVPQHLYYRRPQGPGPQNFYYPSPPVQQMPQQQQPLPPPNGPPPNQPAQPQDQMTGFYPQASPVPYYYRGGPVPIPGPYQYYGGYPERPLTTRDFERLLQLLILRHQYLQRISGPYGPYDPYYGGYQFSRAAIPPPVYGPYDGRFPYRPLPIPPYLEHENMYQAQNQIPHQSEGGPQTPYDLQRLMPRKKQYTPRYFGLQSNQIDDFETGPAQNSPTETNYLPSDVREELLYRMLMLALQSEQSATNAVVTNPAVSNSLTDSDTTSTTTKSTAPLSSYRKPVRSVQILGEEN
ncbi:bromodomain-containing protein DDB_G0270170-like [Condylostylus longicornis]|uniref:bromodomain-containing protein DDB_G0270170-like n=1 Tax=Condylostylus longicornis TaxID=2530218 RepID=UPI00244DB1DF|nr:bromodomain-containing protein DDB_G0270170-like [Condylostylus longicornis]